MKHRRIAYRIFVASALISVLLAPPYAAAQIAVRERAGGPEPRQAIDLAGPDGAGNTCSKGLYAVDSPVEGGGKIVDLQGRFKSMISAEKNADGSLEIRCSQDDPPTAGRDDR